MIRKYMLLLALALAGLSAYAYEWDGSIKCLPEDDEILSYFLPFTNLLIPGDESVLVMSFHGEKEIGGKVYRVLYGSEDIMSLAEGKGRIRSYMREENGKVYRLDTKSDGSPASDKEILTYDFTLKPGESYLYEAPFYFPIGPEEDPELREFLENEFTVRIIDVEIQEIYGKKRIVQRVGYPEGYESAENKIISGIGYQSDGTLDYPFMDRGIQPTTWIPYPVFNGIYDFAGKRHDCNQPWEERAEGEREYLPMLKSGRVWEYGLMKPDYPGFKVDQLLYYRLKDAVNLYGTEYYPVYRSEEESFAEETLVGYLRESCGQVFLRLTAEGMSLPAAERSFTNVGQETILYDMNLDEGAKMELSIYTGHYTDCHYQVTRSKDMSYNSEPAKRRYIETTWVDYLEGVGPVENGTIVYPLIHESFFPNPRSKKIVLQRMWDDVELVFEGSRFSGVEEIAAEEDGEAEYFTLQGIRTGAEAPGIYLRRQGGWIRKVIVR